MPEVHQAPPGGKGGGPPSALHPLRRLVDAAHELRDAWSAELDGPTYPRSLPSFSGLTRELDAWLVEVEARPAASAAEPARALDLADRAATRAWLTDLRAMVDDVVAAAEDATRPASQRTLGRATARSTIVDARHALGRLLAAAEQGARPADG